VRNISDDSGLEEKLNLQRAKSEFVKGKKEKRLHKHGREKDDLEHATNWRRAF
jgi:hypothetical protein